MKKVVVVVVVVVALTPLSMLLDPLNGYQATTSWKVNHLLAIF